VPYHFVDWEAYPEARSQLEWFQVMRVLERLDPFREEKEAAAA
jgi:hypothetical protein